MGSKKETTSGKTGLNHYRQEGFERVRNMEYLETSIELYVDIGGTKKVGMVLCDCTHQRHVPPRRLEDGTTEVNTSPRESSNIHG